MPPRESCDIETSVSDWAIEHPESIRLFDELGIDYCCGGKSLRYECLRLGLSAPSVMEQLRQIVPSLDAEG